MQSQAAARADFAGHWHCLPARWRVRRAGPDGPMQADTRRARGSFLGMHLIARRRSRENRQCLPPRHRLQDKVPRPFRAAGGGARLQFSRLARAFINQGLNQPARKGRLPLKPIRSV